MAVSRNTARRVGALALVLALAPGGATAAAQGLAVGDPAPAFTIPDLDGKPFDLASVLGRKPVFLEFWATWCPLCEALLPQVRAARTKYGDAVVLLGVNVTVNQSKDRVRRYAAEHAVPFRILWDEDGEAVRAYDVTGTSFIVLIDGAGKVAYTGYGADQDLERALARVMGR